MSRISLRFACTISPKRAKFGLFAGPTPWTVIGVWTPDFFSAAWAFFRNYVLKRGFMLGSAGLLVSVLNTHYTFVKLAKLRELGPAHAERR